MSNKSDTAKKAQRGSGRKASVAPNLIEHLRWCRDESLLFGDSSLEMAMTEANPQLCVITGENASGKSLLFRLLAARVHGEKALPVTVSMRERSRSGVEKVFMYLSEEDNSTGSVTVGTVITVFDRNLDREGGTILGLDEPELGLSEGYAHAFGELTGEKSQQIPAVCGGVVIVTHSKAFVKGLLKTCGQAPTFVTLDDQPMTARQWLKHEQKRSVDELLNLPQVNLERWREIGKLLKED